jgi:hypothetical protein
MKKKINDLPDNIIIAKDTIGISQEQWNQMSLNMI